MSEVTTPRGAELPALANLLHAPGSFAKGAVNLMLSPLGIEVVRKHKHDWSDTRNFIPFKETIDAAQQRGMSVGDYIDTVVNNIPGTTQATIDRFHALGVFEQTINTALEIGPGSGRYLEKIIAACRPSRYEIYETSAPWAAYLVQEYCVVWQPTDGGSLAATRDASCDLVQAYKVFSSIPFLPSIRYWAEMLRVTKPGGCIVFDIMTENCLDADAMKRWIGSGIDNGAYPASVPRSIATSYFENGNCTLLGSFLVPIGEGHTETLVFRKKGDDRRTAQNAAESP